MEGLLDSRGFVASTRDGHTARARVYLLPPSLRKGARHGEVVVTVVREALEGCAEQGGKDARVELVEQACQVEGWLDARQGLKGGRVGRSRCRRPSLHCLYQKTTRSVRLTPQLSIPTGAREQYLYEQFLQLQRT